jgi:hypothetical protein
MKRVHCFQLFGSGAVCGVYSWLVRVHSYGALTISPPAFCPGDNSTHTFRSMDSESKNI